MLSGFATSGGHSVIIRFVLTLGGLAAMFATFCFVFHIGTSGQTQTAR
ncbi:MAG: hypothetical protein WDN27_00690 [Candidatus Saccharibacteria bacterium]